MPTGGNLDFNTKEWRINGERVQCTSSAGVPFIGRIVIAETTIIPSGHEAVVPGIIARREGEFAGPAIVEPLEGGGDLAQRGLVLARSLVESGNQIVPLRLFNPGKEKRVAKKGTTVGLISIVDPEQIEDKASESSEVKQSLPTHLLDLYERSTDKVKGKFHD